MAIMPRRSAAKAMTKTRLQGRKPNAVGIKTGVMTISPDAAMGARNRNAMPKLPTSRKAERMLPHLLNDELSGDASCACLSKTY